MVGYVTIIKIKKCVPKFVANSTELALFSTDYFSGLYIIQ